MRPMLATPGDLPGGPEWAFEVKWDGVRALCDVRGGRLRIGGRGGSDLTPAFPELAGLVDVLDDALIDGELVCLDENGVPRFGALASRLGVGRSGRAGARSARRRATLVAFDALRADGAPLLGQPYRERRRVLAALLPDGPDWQAPGAFDDGAALLAATADRGLEGVVAKRRASVYRPGERSRDWVKVAHRRTHSFVVGGWKPAASPGPGRLGSLVVGTPVGSGLLTLDGAVGSGISAAVQRALRPVLDELRVDRTPFTADGPALPGSGPTEPTWCEPAVVVDVAHLGRTEHGLLRQPAVVRLRPDLTYDEVLVVEEGR